MPRENVHYYRLYVDRFYYNAVLSLFKRSLYL